MKQNSSPSAKGPDMQTPQSVGKGVSVQEKVGNEKERSNVRKKDAGASLG